MKIAFISSLIAAALVSASAQAGEWGIGAELGYGGQTFKPHYTLPNGTWDGSYTNRAHGVEVGGFAEYRVPLAPGFSIGAMGRVGVTPATWKLDTTEPAHLTYEIPVTVAFSIVPAVHLDDATALFGELGIAGGYIHHRKESSAYSWYDQRGWQPGLVVGGGAERKLTDRLAVRAFFRYTAYQSRSFDTFGPGGGVVERVKDSPTAINGGLGLVARF